METNLCPGWMTGMLEADTDVASDIMMHKYAREEATGVQAKTPAIIWQGYQRSRPSWTGAVTIHVSDAVTAQSGAKQRPYALDFF